jgi:hypothetical protein
MTTWNRKTAVTTASIALITWTIAAAQPSTAPAGPQGVRFEKHRLGSFRSEALGVADFNGDGRLDVIAGAYLYLAPDWKPVKIRTLAGSVDEEGKGYHDDFMNLPLDVDGDGRPDVVTCGWFSKSVSWCRNTLGREGEWPLMQEEKNGNYEAGQLWDIDGDGKASEILAAAADTQWFEVGTLPDGKPGLIRHVVSTRALDYGGGVGDINGDGRPDILRPGAWYEGPADPRKGEWIEHTWGDIALGAPEGKADHTPEILVYDVDGDGLNDVITSSAHKHGIFWYQQARTGGKITWKQHLIDDTWSQAHSLALADLDGDDQPELITGKRFLAHNGNDPGALDPLGVYYYRLTRGPSPKWTRHVISFDEGIGSGVNLCAVDLDADGDIDVVVTGKWGGPVWFENNPDRSSERALP